MPSSPKAQAMERITVTMQPLPRETRLLLMPGQRESTRASLGPATASPPRAAATFLTGLSLWHQRALSVVLCADAEACSSATQMFDDLGFGSRTEHGEARVVSHAPHRRDCRIQGFGNFGDLQQPCINGTL